MFKRSDFQIGGVLYSIRTYRGSKNYDIVGHNITKIGNKYLEVHNSSSKILISNLTHRDYTGTSWELYRTKQECEDIMEKEILKSKAFMFFNNFHMCDLSLEHLRKISEIIDEVKKERKI